MQYQLSSAGLSRLPRNEWKFTRFIDDLSPTLPLLSLPAFAMAESANIAAGGTTNTTAQLTAPASGSFGGGKISDDTNPSQSVDLATNEYREDEYCIVANATVVVGGEVYEFRVTRNGTALDTYTVTPQWTIGAAAGESSELIAARMMVSVP